MLMNDIAKFPILLATATEAIICATGKGKTENSIRGTVLNTGGNDGYELFETYDSFSVRYLHPFDGTVLIKGQTLENI